MAVTFLEIMVWLTAGMAAVAFIIGRLKDHRELRPRTVAKAAEALALAERLERPMLRLTPASKRGTSKLGGAPEMPAELHWPVGPEGPLAFVAQIDLAEAVAEGGPDWLPDSGRLYFFFDDRLEFAAKSAGDWTVQMTVLFSREDIGKPRPPPPDLAPDREFYERRIGFRRLVSRPTPDWLDTRHLFRFSPELIAPVEAYAPDHRLGGYPAEIQPECFPAECESRRSVANPSETPWRLLLQIDADDELGMVWVDEGRIFVFMRENDARAGDFSETRAFLQFR